MSAAKRGRASRACAARARPPSPRRRPAIPRAAYRAAGSLPRDGIVDLFCERVAEYRATVHRIGADVAATVRAILGGARARRRPGRVRRPRDRRRSRTTALTVAELDALDAVVTGSALAIADTGTIVLDSGPRSGRRALTLVPDHHVCIVEARAIVPSVPDAVAALARPPPRAADHVRLRPVSATSDIELDRVEGVHGPRMLDVIVVDDSASSRT